MYLLDPGRLWLASRFGLKIIANLRKNPAQLFFANLKATNNEEKAQKLAKEAHKFAEEAHKFAEEAITSAEIARRNEEKAQSNEERADQYAEEQKLSVKYVWFWFSPLTELLGNGQWSMPELYSSRSLAAKIKGWNSFSGPNLIRSYFFVAYSATALVVQASFFLGRKPVEGTTCVHYEQICGQMPGRVQGRDKFQAPRCSKNLGERKLSTYAIPPLIVRIC